MRKNDRVKDPIPWQGAADHKISYALACGAFEDFHEEETTERLFYGIDNSGLSENSEYLLRLRETIMYILEDFPELREKIMDGLDSLTERERRVLSLRFGLVDGYNRTLEEVGRQFNVKRARIHQIERKALRKMRLNSFSQCPQIIKEITTCNVRTNLTRQLEKYQSLK